MSKGLAAKVEAHAVESLALRFVDGHGPGFDDGELEDAEHGVLNAGVQLFVDEFEARKGDDVTDMLRGTGCSPPRSGAFDDAKCRRF